MNRDDLDRAFEELGDGSSSERLARQRVRLIEWERQRMRPPAWYLGRPMIAVLGAIAMAVVMFGMGRVVTLGERSRIAEHATPTAESNAQAAAVPAPVPGRAALSGAVGSEPLVAGQWFAATEHPVALRFGEGSRIELARGARGRLAELGSEGLRISIESGHLDAQITPGGGYRWLIHAGPYQVRVVGTAFSVDWQPEVGALMVAVSRGKVEVTQGRAAGGSPQDWVRQLTAGETLRVEQGLPAIVPASPRALLEEPSAASGHVSAARHGTPSGRGQLALPPLSSSEPSDRGPASLKSEGKQTPPGTEPSLLAPPQATAAASASWKSLAEKGEYREAFAAAQSAGFESLIQGASASDLLLLADTARLSGATEPARHALLVLRERYPSHVNATRAGFLLGRLAFEQQHDAEAVRWLREYLAQKPTGPLAEGARSRLLLAQKRLGDRAAAKAAALDYLEHYPQGRSAEAARGILSE